MDSKLIDVWQASAGNPFLPTVGKGTQFLVAFVLLLLGLFSFGIFALSKKDPYLPIAHMRAVPKLTISSSRPFCSQRARHWNSSFSGHRVCLPAPPLPLVLKCDPCLTMLRRVGTVYMFCAVGVYV